MVSIYSTSLCSACLLLLTLATPPVEDESCLLRMKAEGEDPHFEAFKLKHGRKYDTGSHEHQLRLHQFKQHSAEVERQNANPIRRWTAGLNHMADWTEPEIKALHGLKLMATGKTGGAESLYSKHRRKTHQPEEVNWQKNISSLSFAVDQGGCGSCWAVTTTRLLASHSELYGGANKRTFSTQEIVDCSPNPHHCGGAGGCDGSTVTLALDYVMRHGDATIDQDPYQGQDGTCSKGQVHLDGLSNDQIMQAGRHMSTNSAVGSAGLDFGMHGWELLPKNELHPLVDALANIGPVATSVDAEPWSWYSSGIMDSCSADAVISHAVLLIGYGRQPDNTKYWLIQNSWGATWGESGNIRVLRRDDEDTFCGKDRQPELGSGCDGGPSEVDVCGTCGILYENAVPHFRPI